MSEFQAVSIKRDPHALAEPCTVGKHGVTAIRDGSALYSVGVEIWRGEDLAVIPWSSAIRVTFTAKPATGEDA